MATAAVAATIAGLLLATAACSSGDQADPGGSQSPTPAAEKPAGDLPDDATQFVLRPDAGAGNEDLLEGLALVLTERLAGEDASVDVTGDAVAVAFAEPPTTGAKALLTAPTTMELRPVLLVGAPDASVDGGGPVPADAAEAFTASGCKDAVPAGDLLVACDAAGDAKYLLGPVELGGDALAQVTIATGVNPAIPADIAVEVTLDDAGATTFADLTGRLAGETMPMNQIAVVVDGVVVTAPTVNGPIPDGVLWVSSGDLAEVRAIGAQLWLASPAARISVTAG